MHTLLLGSIVAACMFAPAVLAQTAEPRHALVIGNSAYQIGPLANPRRWEAFSPTVSVSTTCSAMSGNGRKIAGTGITAALRLMRVHGFQATAPSASPAAGAGTAARAACVRRIGTGRPPATGATFSVFGSPGRNDHFHLYVFTACAAPQGAAPLIFG